MGYEHLDPSTRSFGSIVGRRDADDETQAHPSPDTPAGEGAHARQARRSRAAADAGGDARDLPTAAAARPSRGGTQRASGPTAQTREEAAPASGDKAAPRRYGSITRTAAKTGGEGHPGPGVRESASAGGERTPRGPRGTLGPARGVARGIARLASDGATEQDGNRGDDGDSAARELVERAAAPAVRAVTSSSESDRRALPDARCADAPGQPRSQRGSSGTAPQGIRSSIVRRLRERARDGAADTAARGGAVRKGRRAASGTLGRISERSVPRLVGLAATMGGGAAALLMAALAAALAIAVLLSFLTDEASRINGGKRIAAIAEAEYASGAADGTFHHDDAKYWDHYRSRWGGLGEFVGGDGGKASPWCASFVAWCADQCGFVDAGIMPATAAANHDEWYRTHPDRGSVIPCDGDYSPVEGDLIVYLGTDGHGSHVGIVTAVAGDGFYTVEGNTSGPGGEGSCVNRRHHRRYDDGHGTGGFTNTDYGGGAVICRPDYPSLGESVIDIPEPYGGGGFTVTMYGTRGWEYLDGTFARVAHPDDVVWRAWVGAGARYTDHIATTGGRYLVACTTTFGEVGDRLTFHLADGTAIPCIMADSKSIADPGCNKWGHANGQNVIEFEVEPSYFKATRANPGTAGWMPQWAGKRVVRCVNESRGATSGTVSDGRLSPRQQAVVAATQTTPSPGAGWCAMWASSVLRAGGVSCGGNACDMYWAWCRSSDKAELRPGMIVAVPSYPTSSLGATYGHVAVYVGDGKVRENVGTIRTTDLDRWISYYGGWHTPKWGWLGGVDLSA